MKIETVSINQLKPHARNPRIHPDHAIDKLVRSIEEFGWTNPVLVSEDGLILAGHARVKAAKKAGIKEVPVIRLPLSGDKATAYMIADNKLQDETDWDMPALKDLLEELDTGAFDMDITGFDELEIEDLMTQFHMDPIEPEYNENGERARIILVFDEKDREEIAVRVRSMAAEIGSLNYHGL